MNLQKKHLLIFIFIQTLLSGTSYSQSAQSVKEKTDSLNRITEQWLQFSYIEAEKSSEEALKISSRHIPYSRSHIKAAALRSDVFLHTNRCPEARMLLDSLMKQESQITDPESQVEMYLAQGQYYYTMGRLDSSRICFHKALQIISSSKKILRPKDYLKIGLVYLKSGEKTESIKYFRYADKLIRLNPDPTDSAWLTYSYSQVYYVQRLFPQALEGSSQALQQFQKLQNIRGMAYSELTRGNCYYLDYKEDSAVICYTNSLHYFREMHDVEGMAMNYANLSRSYLDLHQHDSAVYYAEKALETIAEGNYISSKASIYQQLGDIYGEWGRLPEAVESVKKALDIARKANHKITIRDCYKSLSEIFAAMKQFRPAYDNLLAAYRIKDSILSDEFSRQLAEMQTKYETAHKEEQIKSLNRERQLDALLLEKQKAKLQRQKIMLFMSALVLLLSFTALYFYLSRKRVLTRIREKELIREAEENERLRIAKDIHDDLGSGLSRIKFLTELALSRKHGDLETFRETLKTVSGDAAALVDNMKDLVWVMKPENSTLGSLLARIREYIFDYLEDLPIKVHFSMPDEIPEIIISKTVNRNIQMMLKEAVQNVVKHAESEELIIEIKTGPLLEIRIEDKGKGMDPENCKKGNGLHNMKHRAESINADLQIKSAVGKGTEIKLSLDLSHAV